MMERRGRLIPWDSYSFSGADADCRSYYSHLGIEAADEHSSLLSFQDGGYLDAVLTRGTSKVDDAATLNDLPKKHFKSSFWQSVFNSTNILLGIGILAMPLGFKVSFVQPATRIVPCLNNKCARTSLQDGLLACLCLCFASSSPTTLQRFWPSVWTSSKALRRMVTLAPPPLGAAGVSWCQLFS